MDVGSERSAGAIAATETFYKGFESMKVDRKAAAVMIIVVALGCASSTYRIERKHMDCEDANGQIHRALMNFKYEITRFEPATPGTPGVIEAERQTPRGRRYGRVRIVCDETIVLQPVEGAWFLPTFDFSRDVYYGLLAIGDWPPTPAIPTASETTTQTTRSASRRTKRKTVKRELRVDVRPLDRFETRKETGVDLTRHGLLVVRVAVKNHTTRAYFLRADRVAVINEDGERIRPLTSAAVAARLRESAAAPLGPDEPPLSAIDIPATVRALDGQRLESGKVAPGQTRGGSLYFPAGHYRGARLRLIDEETGEVEGTMVAF